MHYDSRQSEYETYDIYDAAVFYQYISKINLKKVNCG